VEGTNIARISVAVTHGTNHAFYYRGRLCWERDRILKRWSLPANILTRIGFRFDSERLNFRTPEPADVLWLTCACRGQLPSPSDFKAWEATAEGGRRSFSARFDRVHDAKRRVFVYSWPLRGGVERHTGSTLHLEGESNGTPLATIQIH
jgi:hypothetical protein